jgi:hypothetical protein
VRLPPRLQPRQRLHLYTPRRALLLRALLLKWKMHMTKLIPRLRIVKNLLANVAEQTAPSHLALLILGGVAGKARMLLRLSSLQFNPAQQGIWNHEKFLWQTILSLLQSLYAGRCFKRASKTAL